MEMKMNITDAEIKIAESLGACSDALAWLRETPRTWEETICEYGSWILRHAAERLTPERLDACAAAEPWAALAYAAERLTPERLDACATAYPATALRYAAEWLTPERLDACAAAEPWEALRYAAERLTPERLDACATAYPATALEYAAKWLTPERLDACAAAEPGAALGRRWRTRPIGSRRSGSTRVRPRSRGRR
jgi:hypothetical protein